MLGERKKDMLNKYKLFQRIESNKFAVSMGISVDLHSLVSSIKNSPEWREIHKLINEDPFFKFEVRDRAIEVSEVKSIRHESDCVYCSKYENRYDVALSFYFLILKEYNLIPSYHFNDFVNSDEVWFWAKTIYFQIHLDKVGREDVIEKMEENKSYLPNICASERAKNIAFDYKYFLELTGHNHDQAINLLAFVWGE